MPPGQTPTTHLYHNNRDGTFITRWDTLYTMALAWPEDGMLAIKSLASNSQYCPDQIVRFGLLGSESNLQWSRNDKGVTVKLPQNPPCDYAYVFKIDPSGV